MTPEQRSAAIGDADWTDDRSLRELIEYHIRVAVAEEREACACLLENLLGDDYLASKIRARGQCGQTGPVS